MPIMPAINAATRIPASERLARQDYARQLEQTTLEREITDEVDFSLNGMTIDEFKASDKYAPFTKHYKQQAKNLKAQIQHRLPISDQAKQVLLSQVDEYMAGAFDDSKSKFKRFSDDYLKNHVYTGMRRNLEQYNETLAESGDAISMDDIARLTILFLPEQGNNPAWAEFCMEQALQTLKARQEEALQYPKHQSSQAENSPIFHAVNQNKFDTAHKLLKVKDKGVNPREVDVHGRNILHIVALKGNADLAEELAAKRNPKFNPAELDDYGNHALHLAVKSGSLATVQAMMKAVGDNAFIRNDAGKTPLHLAAEKKSNDILDFLVKHANQDALDAQDQNGNTAAQISAKMDNPEAVKKLVTAGTNTKLLNNADQSLHALMMNITGGGQSVGGGVAAGAA
ncbi:ankyrin repeat domain-containing protein [Shewanella sp. 202IG2-18]|uniref:ankyrin repeat domain-containing protein n=1 Tax=Parashewanella hymeniacidonis TaxID=2807618 RepID=UPI001961A072|nr:ankyrin repeat domain-containing protein [Parashewanella hymeniacidonis]MBM7072359.1 ankyrin repeat domain-containing protein [Parashewanella hymeniacidonis]